MPRSPRRFPISFRRLDNLTSNKHFPTRLFSLSPQPGVSSRNLTPTSRRAPKNADFRSKRRTFAANAARTTASPLRNGQRKIGAFVRVPRQPSQRATRKRRQGASSPSRRDANVRRRSASKINPRSIFKHKLGAKTLASASVAPLEKFFEMLKIFSNARCATFDRAV